MESMCDTCFVIADKLNLFTDVTVKQIKNMEKQGKIEMATNSRYQYKIVGHTYPVEEYINIWD